MERLRCPKCHALISDVLIQRRAGALASRARKENKGGRPPKLEPCPGCGTPLSARDRRLHRCPNLPAPKQGRPRKVVQTLEI
jgi:hypothetical protein